MVINPSLPVLIPTRHSGALVCTGCKRKFEHQGDRRVEVWGEWVQAVISDRVGWKETGAGGGIFNVW